MRGMELKGIQNAEELERLYRNATNTRTARRLLAIYLKRKGNRTSEIAHELGVTPKTVRSWVKLFNAGGPRALAYVHTAGRFGKLTAEQEQALLAYLKRGRPDGRSWTLRTLAEKLLEDYGVCLSQQQVSQRIRRHRVSESISKAEQARSKGDRRNR